MDTVVSITFYQNKTLSFDLQTFVYVKIFPFLFVVEQFKKQNNAFSSNLFFCFIVQLYNEEILDLFDSTRDPENRHRKSNIKIHEDASGGIYTTGVTSRLISSQDEVSDLIFLHVNSFSYVSSYWTWSSYLNLIPFTLPSK